MSGLIVIFKIKMLYDGFCWIIKKEDTFEHYVYLAYFMEIRIFI